jgi:hypothetical protein
VSCQWLGLHVEHQWGEGAALCNPAIYRERGGEETIVRYFRYCPLQQYSEPAPGSAFEPKCSSASVDPLTVDTIKSFFKIEEKDASCLLHFFQIVYLL